MSKLAVEIRDMLRNGINNTDQYKILNVEIVLRAANMLHDGLIKNEIEIQDLQDHKIGHMVNNIRKNNKENVAVKTLLRQLVQKMQDLAQKKPVGTKQNGTVNGHKERRPASKKTTGQSKGVTAQNGKSQIQNGTPVVNGHDENEHRKSTPNEIDHPRLPKVTKLNDPIDKKSKVRKSKIRNSPKIRASPVTVTDTLHPSPPKIKSAPPSNPTLIKSITLRLDPERDALRTDSSTVRTETPPTQAPAPKREDNSDKGKNIPNETENVPNENLSELKSTNPSSNNSIPTLPEENHSRKRKLPTANPTETQSETTYVKTKTESEIFFSDRVRFIPSVTVEPDQNFKIPSTPDHKIVSQAAEGDEIEGITGVRDVQGNFHRWHHEISLEPDGTEPFMHILPYVDIDLELL